MILSDNQIREYVEAGKIIVDPEPDWKEQLSGASLDLRLGNEFRVFDYAQATVMDPKNPQECTNVTKIENGEYFVVHPGEFVLGITEEVVGIDSTICSRIDGKSSVGRLGIVVHSTAGHVNPGWKGKLTLEISNIGRIPVLLYPGMRICQLVFEVLTTPATVVYQGKYMNQKAPLESKISREKIK